VHGVGGCLSGEVSVLKRFRFSLVSVWIRAEL